MAEKIDPSMEWVKESEIMMKKKHLPVIGVGPILCVPMILISIIAVFLSIKGTIPYTVTNRPCKIVFILVGILLIIEGAICFLCADIGGGVIESIKSNKLKTNGAYAFVRNPCYALFFLGSTGVLMIAHNPVLLALPFVFWIEMTVVLKNTEEKWLQELYGKEYIEYCKRVNRCFPWFPRRSYT